MTHRSLQSGMVESLDKVDFTSPVTDSLSCLAYIDSVEYTPYVSLMNIFYRGDIPEEDLRDLCRSIAVQFRRERSSARYFYFCHETPPVPFVFLIRVGLHCTNISLMTTSL